MPKDVLVVIISHNGLSYTRQCVLSLTAQTANIRILVWDNASTDGTQEWLKSQSMVEYYLSEENLMWSPAINKALDLFYDGETYICFMNNDITVTDSDTFTKLIETASKDDVGMVVPAAYGIGGVQDFVSNQEIYALHDKEIRVNYVIGAMILMRYDVWKQIGILDPNMPLGADDHDYSIRVKHEGYKIIVRKDTIVDHKCHATSDSPFWEIYGGSSWAYFNEKWASYYVDEKEATTGHWDGLFNEQYPRGSGWEEDKYIEKNKDLRK
jgi:GT2 family glycosyltransferase